MRFRSFGPVVILLAGFSGSAPAIAQSSCPVDPAAVMAENAIDPAKVEKTNVEAVQSGFDQLRTTGYRLWLRGKSCSGSVVFEFDRACRPTGNYARGDCTIGALKK